MLDTPTLDPWQTTISALSAQPVPLATKPAHRGRVVRMADEESLDPDHDARVDAFFRSLPASVTEPEARVLYALASTEVTSQRALARLLDMDRANLSRRLRKLAGQGLVARNAQGWHLCRGLA